MSATGLEVFDKTLQTTNIWLDEMMEVLGPDRHTAWHALGAVLRPLRDRLPLGLTVHLGAQLPLLVRGAYFEQWQPERQPDKTRSLDTFLQHVQDGLSDTRPVNAEDATSVVFHVLSRHVDRGQIAKVHDALPSDLRRIWPDEWLAEAPGAQRAAGGRRR